MKVHIYENVHDFMEENQCKLLEREAITQLILYNGMVNRSSSTNDALLFGKVVDRADKAIIFFCNVIPYNLLINTANSRYEAGSNKVREKEEIGGSHYVREIDGKAGSNKVRKHVDIAGSNDNRKLVDNKDGYDDNIEFNTLKDSVMALADYIVDNNIYIKGLNANKDICVVFLSRYQELMKCDYNEHLAMDIMELKQLNYVTVAEGISRKAELSEKELIAKWIVDFAKDAMNEDLNYEDQLMKAERMILAGVLQVYEIPGYGLVSMAAASRQLVNGVCINYVFTPKEYRGKGYAISNMYALSKEMLDKGNQFCTLFVDKKNPISNRVYKKIGYQIVENQYDYRILCN